MHHNFSDQFSTLREEFRLLQSGFRPKNTMADQALNAGWFTMALLNSSNRSTETDLSIDSSSSHLSPFRSSESSHSSAESERAQSEAPTATIASGSDDLGAPLQQGNQHDAEIGDKSLDNTIVHPRSRKGHKKSREGCFNCKRRKIKVRMILTSLPRLT